MSEEVSPEGAEVNGWIVRYYQQPNEHYAPEYRQKMDLFRSYTGQHFMIDEIKALMKRMPLARKVSDKINKWNGETKEIKIDKDPKYVGGSKAKITIEPVRMKVGYRFKIVAKKHINSMVKSANKK